NVPCRPQLDRTDCSGRPIRLVQRTGPAEFAQLADDSVLLRPLPCKARVSSTRWSSREPMKKGLAWSLPLVLSLASTLAAAPDPEPAWPPEVLDQLRPLHP